MRPRFSLVIAISILLGPALRAESRVWFADSTIGLGSADVAIPIHADLDAPVYGFQLALRAANERIALTGVDLRGTAAASAEWSDGTIDAGGTALTWGVVMDSSPPDLARVLPAGVGLRIARVLVDVVGDEPGTTAIEFDESPGPPVRVTKLVTRRGEELPVALESAQISIVEIAFLRGDGNGDEEVDLSDGVYILNFLFLGGPEPPCSDAADANDSGSVDIADAVYVFNYLFIGGDLPPSPFPQSGSDPTQDGLGCSTAL